jgi:hypothetical protein
VTLPVPPADPLELAETFPVRELPVSYRYYRLHHHDREPEWFCTCGQCRFDPPDSLSFGTCYVAAHPLGASSNGSDGCVVAGSLKRHLASARLSTIGLDDRPIFDCVSVLGSPPR